MWILPCALIEEISAIDAMRARMGAATAAATGHFSDGTVLQLHAMHGTTTTTMCVCVCLCKSATMAGCCGWYKYNYNNNNNRLLFFTRAPALSSLSCLLLRSLCSVRVCVFVSDTISSLFSNIFKVYCAKIYSQTRRDNTAAAAQQQQQQNTNTTTTTHWLLWNILTTFTVRRCLFLPRSRARDWGLSCRCVDQKVMRPFHFAPARAAHSLPTKLQFTSHTHIHCGEYRNSIDEAGGKANERKRIFFSPALVRRKTSYCCSLYRMTHPA